MIAELCQLTSHSAGVETWVGVVAFKFTYSVSVVSMYRYSRIAPQYGEMEPDFYLVIGIIAPQ